MVVYRPRKYIKTVRIKYPKDGLIMAHHRVRTLNPNTFASVSRASAMFALVEGSGHEFSKFGLNLSEKFQKILPPFGQLVYGDSPFRRSILSDVSS